MALGRENDQMNFLGKGTTFKGKLRVNGNIRVDGTFDGEIEVSESIIIGKSGLVKGEVKSKAAVLGGKLEGNIFASDKIELQTGARLSGDITCRSLLIQDGVFFEGNCRMSPDNAKEPLKVSKVK
jgi:cytoskeletal protein CcmA (bactofilin family)